jgi:hypothetical protein
MNKMHWNNIDKKDTYKSNEEMYIMDRGGNPVEWMDAPPLRQTRLRRPTIPALGKDEADRERTEHGKVAAPEPDRLLRGG